MFTFYNISFIFLSINVAYIQLKYKITIERTDSGIQQLSFGNKVILVCD